MRWRDMDSTGRGIAIMVVVFILIVVGTWAGI